MEVTFTDVINSKNVKEVMRENTKIIYLETSENPTLGFSDIEAISEIAHEK